MGADCIYHTNISFIPRIRLSLLEFMAAAAGELALVSRESWLLGFRVFIERSFLCCS